MNQPQLTAAELALIRGVFHRHPEVAAVVLFGSRAKGTSQDRSDVDLAVEGDLTPLQAEGIASELDDLPLPYRFDVRCLARIDHHALREHIDRVGIRIYQAA